ncbi:MAG: alpha-2-macroglobulin family protein, partial [Bacteroidota bacterium]
MFYYFDRDYQQVTPGETISLPLVCQENLPLVLSSWGSRETKRLYERSQVNNRHLFTHDITDGDRGILYFQYEFVKHNRYFRGQKRITVTWPTKKLAIEYETFRDKLRPGEEEEWRIRIDDHEGGPASAQVLASMYDASLDQLASYEWGFWPHQSYAGARNRLSSTGFSIIYGYGIYNNPGRPPRRSYIAPGLLLGPLNFWGGGYYYPMSYALEDVENHDLNPYRGNVLRDGVPPPAPAASAPMDIVERKELRGRAAVQFEAGEEASSELNLLTVGGEAPIEEAPPVQIRENLQETAFWYPDLRTDEEGKLVVAFTAPEALTRWKLQLLAHTPELAYAIDSREVVTQKELMILPNAPRFMREGDRIVFTAKVSNLSEKVLSGEATIELFDPETEEAVDFKVAAPNSSSRAVSFSIDPKGNEAVAWEIDVPEGSAGLIGYRVIARAGNFSDGEQNVLPILTNRIFLTATKPFYIKPGEKKVVELSELARADNAGGSLVHEGFSFELTNNPSWLAVKSLPYLMEYPHECTEQIV